jgi:hypothetical protein
MGQTNCQPTHALSGPRAKGPKWQRQEGHGASVNQPMLHRTDAACTAETSCPSVGARCRAKQLFRITAAGRRFSVLKKSRLTPKVTSCDDIPWPYAALASVNSHSFNFIRALDSLATPPIILMEVGNGPNVGWKFSAKCSRQLRDV